jgi:hypothetical protein
MMATMKITFRLAWWFKYYLQGVTFMCAITGCEPDIDKVSYWAGKALRVAK